MTTSMAARENRGAIMFRLQGFLVWSKFKRLRSATVKARGARVKVADPKRRWGGAEGAQIRPDDTLSWPGSWSYTCSVGPRRGRVHPTWRCDMYASRPAGTASDQWVISRLGNEWFSSFTPASVTWVSKM